MEQFWCRYDATGLRIAVRVQPRAGVDRICGIQGGRLKVRIAAAPVDEAANDKLLAIAGVNRLPPALAGLPVSRA
jgi:uncharacterized protein YggU (UPF0235/DUF167 family)